MRPPLARNRSAARCGAPGYRCQKAARARAPRGRRPEAPSPTTWFRLLIERVHHGLRGRCLFCAENRRSPIPAPGLHRRNLGGHQYSNMTHRLWPDRPRSAAVGAGTARPLLTLRPCGRATSSSSTLDRYAPARRLFRLMAEGPEGRQARNIQQSRALVSLSLFLALGKQFSASSHQRAPAIRSAS